MSKQWFRFYPGDYLRDTQLLTPEEHGCYMLMIMHYYSTGKPLPADRFVLSKTNPRMSRFFFAFPRPASYSRMVHPEPGAPLRRRTPLGPETVRIGR